MVDRLLIVGGEGGSHVGSSFKRAAQEMGIAVELVDMAQAFAAPKVIRLFFWRLSRRPAKLAKFGKNLARRCREFSPDMVLTTGIAPVFSPTLRVIKANGIKCVNFLTDDPWNPGHYAPWFVQSLQHYDEVFTPRTSNIEQLQKILPGRSHYLPFGYDPLLFYPDRSSPQEKQGKIVFVGTGDPDRFKLMRDLHATGMPLALYGRYWGKDVILAPLSHGQTEAREIRRVTSQSRLCICLVRRANRDGHVMRSFEIPACGAPMLMEYTKEHEQIFGEDGECARYFKSDNDMPIKAKELWEDDAELNRLARAAFNRITEGRHTYRDRLENIIIKHK